jgi:hypothetical protein
MRTFSRVSGLVLGLWVLVGGMAGAQVQTGDLYGVARDTNGDVLPGVTVTLTGIGAARTQVTDPQGAFRFVGLYPGSYVLTAELDGFSTVEQTIAVRLGSKTELDVVLSAALQETISITAEVPVISARDQNLGSTLSQQELDRIPTARDPWALLRQAPGVVADRINVGGNESGQQSDFLAGGATTADNTFSVDGVVLTDMAAVGASATYFDFGAYEEVQLTTASTDVTIQTQGVTVNQITKRGTNLWKGDGRYLRTEGSLQSAPREENGNEIDGVEEYGLNFGGPLVTDHLWLWASYGESDIGNIAQGGQLDRTELEDFNTKLNFQFGSNAGVLHYWTNDKIKNGRNAGPLFAPESTWNQTTPQDIYKIEDSHLFGSSFYVSVLASRDDGAFTLTPQGGLDADMYFDENGVVNGSYFDFTQDGVITQYKADASGFFNTGGWSHELKFGGSYREQENDSISTLPRGRYVHACEDYGCDPGEDNIELVVWTRHNVAVTSEYQAAWIQDTVEKGRWTITGGLRLDRQTAVNDANRDPGNPEVPDGLYPAIEFDGNDADDLDWNSLVPRVGVTYALNDKGNTLLRGTFSQYAAQLGQGTASRVGPFSAYSYVYYYFTDANRNLVFDPSEAGSLSYYYAYAVNVANPGSTASANRNDPDLDPYLTTEGTIGLQHALGKSGLSATVVYRNTEDLLELRDLVFDETGHERVATRDDYELVDTTEVTLPNGNVVSVDEYDLRDGLSRTGGQLLTNGDREIQYLGITLGYNRPLADGWGLRANVTYSDSDLEVGPEFERYDDPTDVIFTNGYGDDAGTFVQQSSYRAKRGVLLNNRWSFNIAAQYQVAPERPWGFNVATNITGREGYPSTPFIGSNAFQLQLDEIDADRNDDLVSVDARIDKDFKVGDLVITASFDAFNLFNSQPVLQRNRNFSNESDPFVIERLSPRVFRWGLTFHYR